MGPKRQKDNSKHRTITGIVRICETVPLARQPLNSLDLPKSSLMHAPRLSESRRKKKQRVRRKFYYMWSILIVLLNWMICAASVWKRKRKRRRGKSWLILSYTPYMISGLLAHRLLLQAQAKELLAIGNEKTSWFVSFFRRTNLRVSAQVTFTEEFSGSYPYSQGRAPTTCIMVVPILH